MKDVSVASKTAQLFNRYGVCDTRQKYQYLSQHRADKPVPKLAENPAALLNEM